MFDEPEQPAAHEEPHVAYVDGASRGNPGPASYAVILRAPGGQTVFEIGKYLGRATNNVAEYFALITALDYAQSQGIARLKVRSDSELLVRQMQGRYKVKSPDLRPLFERAKKMSGALVHFAIEHVPRELNREADELANKALDNTSKPAGRGALVAASQEQPSAAGQPAAKAPRSAAKASHPIRARYSAGALHPLEPLPFDEGDMVEVKIEKIVRE